MTEVTKICIILGILRFLKGREIRRCCFYPTFFLPVCVYLIMHYISLCALFFSPCMAVYEKKRKKEDFTFATLYVSVGEENRL